MRYIESYTEGMHIHEVLLCRSKTVALTKNGKEYENVVLQDKTGQIEGKIWEPFSPGISDFEPMSYVEVDARVNFFNNSNQLNIQRIAPASEGSYDPADYFPVSARSQKEMKEELLSLIGSIEEPHLHALLEAFFVEDQAFFRRFSTHSAAKSVHHSFIGGLMEHSLSVAWLCDQAASHYPFVKRDLLLTAALLHDIGKTRELSPFPYNDYTDEGQLLGHIVIGEEMVREKAENIENFPKKLLRELCHLILSHHGELEFGSPKKPALIEALILSVMDNLDAKTETMREAILSKQPVNTDGWLGYSKLLDSNIRKTGD